MVPVGARTKDELDISPALVEVGGVFAIGVSFSPVPCLGWSRVLFFVHFNLSFFEVGLFDCHGRVGLWSWKGVVKGFQVLGSGPTIGMGVPLPMVEYKSTWAVWAVAEGEFGFVSSLL